MGSDRMTEDLLPLRNPDTLVAGFDDAYVIFDPRCSEVHLLGAMSAVVFDACDGSPRSELIEDITSVLGVDESVADAAIDQQLAEFERTGLLLGTTPEERPP